MFKEIIENVRKQTPLVHNITNYVTVNDCANILLACGASPIMSDDIDEVCEITSVCQALNINIGTLNSRTIPAMFAAGKRANELNHPVVLDPVGAGASTLRTSTALELINKVKFDLIRGNISEIKALAVGGGSTRGVDANIDDIVSDDNLDEAVCFAKSYAAKTGAIIAITGAIDIVSDSEKAFIIRNGHKLMSSITGTGCQLSAMSAAFIAANSENQLTAAAAAVAAMGICGQIAAERMSKYDGNSAMRGYIIDAIFNLDGDALEESAKYTII